MVEQPSLLDAPPVEQPKHPPPEPLIPQQPQPEAPATVQFSTGDRVSIAPFTCQGRTIRPWHGKAGTLQRIDGGIALIDFGVPGHPYPCAAKHLSGPTEVAEKPKQPEAGETLCEWRWWESTGRWTYTGRMGLGMKPSHPNSKLFLHGIDPNKEAHNEQL